MYISVFPWGSRWAKNYFSNVKTKAVVNDSRKVNCAQCLYKKGMQHFYIEPILYSENKIIRSVVGGKVDGLILSGTRSEKRKHLFGTK